MVLRSLGTGAAEGRRRVRRLIARALAVSLVFASAALPAAQAQRHSLGSAPPTAPTVPAGRFASEPVKSQPVSGPVAAVSSGMGAIQFFPANVAVPAPQALTRQLSADDERTRAGALSSLGAPAQYLGKGHVPYPHSVQLDLAQLGDSDQIDALLTVELDQHIVTAVLAPTGENWRRVATLMFPTSFSNAATTPATFARPLRSWLQPDRYRAVFRATVSGAVGDFTENEVDLHVVNNRAVVVLDFVSGARQCDATGQLRPPHQGCELIQRWLQPDPADPRHRFVLISGMGHLPAHEPNDPLSASRNYYLTHLRSFTCQPFEFSESAMHFEPTANAVACGMHEPPRPSERSAEHPPERPTEHPTERP